MMISKTAILLLAGYFILPVGALQQTPGMGAQASSSQSSLASAAENAQIRQMGARKDDAQALRDDIKRMRALVQQMETNLAFVDNTQSPLKHQFQLEIDAWNVLIDQMERRAQASGR
jgi:hypothetical protein